MSAPLSETFAVSAPHGGDVPTLPHGRPGGHRRRTIVAPAGMVAAVAAFLLASCDARIISDRGGGPCTICHGGMADDTGAPPFDTGFATESDAVGAHRAHVRAGVACESCHVVPENADSPDHADGDRAEVTFGGLAAAGIARPEYDPRTLRCSGVYCHGATLGAGGSQRSPRWTETLGPCGSCHDAPPLSHGVFVDPSDCSGCHGASVEADDVTFKAAHVDGSLDLDE
jgi:predicted CxxxxCH...CXXCH cytochrome family protein